MTADTREKIRALREAALFRPYLGLAVIALNFGTALFEGVGLGFLLPIIEIAQSPSSSAPNGFLGAFVRAYAFFGIPFTLEYLILGVASVMAVRFSLSFLSSWLQSILGLSYQRHLRRRLFESLMNGPIGYIDEAGTDDLLNSLITETNRASGIVMAVFNIVEVVLRGLIYLAIAAFLAPVLTFLALVGLGVSTLAVRFVFEPAYAIGDEVADMNDDIQTISQAGVQGMRDVRLFNMQTELVEQMRSVLDRYVSVSVKFRRNQAALSNLNQFSNALVVFALVYLGFRSMSLTLAELGVFLFAIFRLSPVVNQTNNALYQLDGQLPHFVRVRSRLHELETQVAPIDQGGRSIESVDRVEFDDVSFSYEDEDRVLRNVSFDVERGEQIAFVGPSGGGKSTIVALLARLQTPDSGRILADDVPISELDVEAWRNRLAVVRQDPFLFNDTLGENIRVGNRDAPQSAVERAAEVAQVTEFLPDLPDGYETELGEDGVRLSGGQRQRVAIARALLKDADLLILDEATSELDTRLERDVYEGINALEDQYAAISVAHRLSTVVDADQIYTLVDGSIVEGGTHDELLDHDDAYADLYANQP